MNIKLIASGILFTAICIGAIAWMKAETVKDAKPSAEVAAVQNNEIPTAAGQDKKAADVATPVQPIAEQQNVASTEPKEQKASDLPPEELAKIRADLKQSVETKFNEKLGFPLNEAMMIAYAQSSLKVKKINNKWDVQIAAADNNTTAIEYNNMAVEEITKSLQNANGLTVDQYNSLTKLTATDQEFNSIYQVYKQLLEEGIIKPVTAAVIAPVPATTVATPVSAPANPGIAPATPGSPKTPYSPQPSR